MTLGTGAVRTHLSDEGGRIDIGKAPVEVLAALFRSVGASVRDADAIALAIASLRNPTDAAAGAADRPQAPAGPPGAPVKKANAELPFTDIRQLALIPGISPEWVTAITPLATVYGNETVNPLSAPAQVIAALPGIDPSRVQAFVQMRNNFPADVSQFASMLGTDKKYLALKKPSAVSVHLTATLVNGFAQAARAIIVPMPESAQPYRILVWDLLSSQSAE
jgi:general secretion pathway protein K